MFKCKKKNIKSENAVAPDESETERIEPGGTEYTLI